MPLLVNTNDVVPIGSTNLSLPNHSPEDAMLALPPIDGLHLTFDPCRGWLALNAFFCIEDQFEPVSSDTGRAGRMRPVPRLPR